MDKYPGSDLKEKGFIIERTYKGMATQKFVVTRPDNIPWPDNREIINFCNSGVSHFGGRVNRWITVAYVDVYK